MRVAVGMDQIPIGIVNLKNSRSPESGIFRINVENLLRWDFS